MQHLQKTGGGIIQLPLDGICLERIESVLKKTAPHIRRQDVMMLCASLVPEGTDGFDASGAVSRYSGSQKADHDQKKCDHGKG